MGIQHEQIANDLTNKYDECWNRVFFNKEATPSEKEESMTFYGEISLKMQPGKAEQAATDLQKLIDEVWLKLIEYEGGEAPLKIKVIANGDYL